MYCEKLIAVVIPCYKVKSHIEAVVSGIPSWVDYIIVVDDACPEKSGDYMKNNCKDPRLRILYHAQNRGVGGACITGYRQADALGCEIIVKMDGDDQMDPDYLSRLIHPIATGFADYTKGNRFYHLDALQSMPPIRRFGNFGLTLLTKVASGFWRISDPTNGYTAIHSSLLSMISSFQLAQRYFFETSILIQLNIISATVADIPIPARYGSENSSMQIKKILLQFPILLLQGLLRRLYWKYYIYNVNAISVLLIFGLLMTTFGGGYGLLRWVWGVERGEAQSAGTVALALLPSLLGVQMLLQAMLLDVMDKPEMPLHKLVLKTTKQIKVD